MEFIVFLIIVFAIISNIRKAGKTQSSSKNTVPPCPNAAAQAAKKAADKMKELLEHMDMEDAEGATAKYAPAEADKGGAKAGAMPAAPMAAQPARLSEERPAMRRPPAPISPVPTVRPAGSPSEGMALSGSLVGQYSPSAMASPCDEGYGSIAHVQHEGAPSERALDRSGRPGSLSERPAMQSEFDGMEGGARNHAPAVSAPSEDDILPELMDMQLDAETMRRAVALSEIINKRGGRCGWVKS